MPLQRKREGLSDGERVVIVWKSCAIGDGFPVAAEQACNMLPESQIRVTARPCMPRADAEAWRREVAPQYPALALRIELCPKGTTSDIMCGKNGRYTGTWKEARWRDLGHE